MGRVDPLWPNVAIWCQTSWSTLVQVMACCMLVNHFAWGKCQQPVKYSNEIVFTIQKLPSQKMYFKIWQVLVFECVIGSHLCSKVTAFEFDVKLFFNTLRSRQNDQHFPDVFKYIFLNENVWFFIKISLKFVPKDPIDSIPALVQIMAWRWTGAKPLSESMMA